MPLSPARRLAAVAGSLLLACAPAVVEASTSGPQAPTAAATKGFVRVERGASGMRITSPAAGVLYVATPGTGGRIDLTQRTRTSRGMKVSPTFSTTLAGSTGFHLTSGGGRTYLVVGTPKTAATMTAFEVVGTSLRPVAIPTQSSTTNNRLAAASATADASGRLVVAFNRFIDTIGPGMDAARWDGSRWSWAPQRPFAQENARRTWASGSTVFVETGSYSTGLTRWDDTGWAGIGGASSSCRSTWCYGKADYTFASSTDLTAWGWTMKEPVTSTSAVTSTCTHVTAGSWTSCPAPAWPVAKATRLADGSVVLGGANDTRSLTGFPSSNPLTTPAGFALVGTQDAQPVALSGEVGTTVTQLVTEPGTSIAWAVGASATGDVLQVLNAPRPTGLPYPKAPTRTLHRPL